MMKSTLALTCFSAVCLAAGVNAAEAQTRHHKPAVFAEARPLTVTKRSWLDVGNVVAVGTQNSYLSASTTLNQPTYASYIPGKFGQSTLPDRFSLAFSNENPRGPQSGGIFFDSP